MPGDFERRGLVTNRITDTYDASLALGTETQYLVAGARVVWKPGAVGGGGTGFDRDARVTLAMTNLLQSTAGVVDLVTGALLEVATFYPNGARETLRANSDVEEFALEPVGFTGKEDDSEVGLVYFGMRYLMPHLGRWASPDPLQIHAGGGGEFGNSYHYVSGNLLQARDPLGLESCEGACNPGDRGMFTEHHDDGTFSRGIVRDRSIEFIYTHEPYHSEPTGGVEVPDAVVSHLPPTLRDQYRADTPVVGRRGVDAVYAQNDRIVRQLNAAGDRVNFWANFWASIVNFAQSVPAGASGISASRVRPSRPSSPSVNRPAPVNPRPPSTVNERPAPSHAQVLPDMGANSRPAPTSHPSLWSMNAFQRGRLIEDAVGGNLGWNYPTIDIYSIQTGHVTSIKTMDLSAPTYATISNVRSVVQRHVRALASFQPRDWGGYNLQGLPVNDRVLLLVVKNPTMAQMTELRSLQSSALNPTVPGRHSVRIEISILGD